MTLRLRLTLLYGAVFIAAGAGLLAVTYGLFKHNQSNSSTTIGVSNFTLPYGAIASGLFSSRAAQTRSVSPTSKAPRITVVAGNALGSGQKTSKPTARARQQFVKAPPGVQKALDQIRSSGQRQLRTLAARATVKLRSEQASDASSLLEWSAIALGVVALLSIGLAWWLAGRALRPLRTMNTRAREISAESLHQRLGVDDRRDELGELATTFDALLARLETSFDSQRRFVANASHELRTPITLERTLVEVALADPDASADTLRRVCERVVASTEEQERMLDALLTLARSEAGVNTGESVDLAAVAEDALASREQRLAGIAVESSLEPAVVVGDRALLERVIGNLVDNAIVHNGGDAPWISIATFLDDDGVPGLKIANGGDAIEHDDIDQLFEPFRRGIGERLGSEGRGLGLGLSIVRAVAIAHSAQIDAHGRPDGGLELELRFTAVPGAKPPAGGVQPVST